MMPGGQKVFNHRFPGLHVKCPSRGLMALYAVFSRPLREVGRTNELGENGNVAGQEDRQVNDGRLHLF